MTKAFLITERSDLRDSLHRYLSTHAGLPVKSMVAPETTQLSPEDCVHWVPRTFEKIASWMESSGSETTPLALSRTIAFIEDSTLTDFQDLDPLNIYRGWSAVVGMLLLAFPEVHWVIVSGFQPSDRLLADFHFVFIGDFIQGSERVLKRYHDGFVPQFDPLGLRNHIRRRIKLRAETSYVPVRAESAVAIDDEESYAWLNAYICYRFGFKCHVLTSYGLVSTVLSEKADVSLSFEDLYLNFADKREGLSLISRRDEIFPVLRTIRRRIFVTGGHEVDTWTKNISYLKQRWRDGVAPSYQPRLRFRWRAEFRPSDNPPTSNYVWVLYKPEAGVFDVWRRSGLNQELPGGKAAGFEWPPEKKTSQGHMSHSAPGRMLLIASRLISRAERIVKSAESVSEAVQGATLTLEAQEYLGYRTPTTALDAVALKHQLEVLAECMFYGVEYSLDTKQRFAEISGEVDHVASWVRSKTREISKINAQLGIISDMVRIYRSFNQFDEEQAGLAKLRDVYRKLWFERNRNRPWAWMTWLLRWYLDALLNSIVTFGFVIFGWLSVFTSIYAFLPHRAEPHSFLSNVRHGLEDAIVTFFGLQPPHELFVLESHGVMLVAVTMILIVMGFLHLGIFVSHLYAMMTRR